MMHKNRNKPVYLFSSSPSNRGEELKRRTKRANQRTVTFFLVFLYLFTLISFIIPLRPTYSDLEQRNLTKFPTPTLATISNGEFFEGVNTWFADTFPFREQFLKLETGVTGLYGVKTSQVATIAARPTAATCKAPRLAPASNSIIVPFFKIIVSFIYGLLSPFRV